MVQKIITEFIDDIDGSPAERTFTFAVDGTTYEIDLSAENIAGFKSAIGGSSKVLGRSRAVEAATVATFITPGLMAVGSPVSKPELYGSGPASTATTSAIGAGSRHRSSRRSIRRT
jgi:hypothetical protein